MEKQYTNSRKAYRCRWDHRRVVVVWSAHLQRLTPENDAVCRPMHTNHKDTLVASGACPHS